MKAFILAVALLLIPAAAASADQVAFEVPGGMRAAQEVKTTSLSKIRAQAFLPQVKLNQDPALNALLEDYIVASEALTAPGPGNYDAPENLAYCSCYLYERTGDGFRFISPSDFAASRGQSGQFGAWVMEAPSLDEIPEGVGLELFLDSRLTDIAVRRHAFPEGEVLVLFARLAGGGAEIRAAQNPLDAYEAAPLLFTSPWDTQKFQIDLWNGREWLNKFSGTDPANFSYDPGFHGLRLNYFGDDDNLWSSPALAWGARYRIRAGGKAGEFLTRKITPPRKSWMFAKSMSSKYKRMFLASIRKMHPTYRAIVKQVAPYTVVKTHAGGGYSIANGYDSNNGNKSKPFSISFARGHLDNKAFRREVVAHEIAHIVDFAGFDDQTYKVFVARFKKSRAWRRCNPSKPNFSEISRWPCLENQELIADQIAYAANNRRSGQGGYGDPRLISTSQMMQLLKRYYHFTNPFGGSALTDSEWGDVGPIAEIASLKRPVIRDRFVLR